MLRFFLSRVGQTIAVLFSVSVIIFAPMRITGDAVLMMLGDDFTQEAYLVHVNEQKIFAKHVKSFQMIPAGLINTHAVWLDKA